MDDLPKIGDPYPVTSTIIVEPVVTSTSMETQKVIPILTTSLDFRVQRINGYAREKLQGKLPAREAATLKGYLASLTDSDAMLRDGRRVSTAFHAVRYWLERLGESVS